MPRQDSTTDQLIDVASMATEAGCYDAGDIIKQHLRDHDEGQRYFKMEPGHFGRASQALLAVLVALNRPSLKLHSRRISSDVWVWTEDRAAQRLLRDVLLCMEVEFEETATPTALVGVMGC